MARKTPNVLDDLLFHTAETTRQASCPVDEAGFCVPIPRRRWVALQDYAAVEGITVEEAVDRALKILLTANRAEASRKAKKRKK